MKTKNLYLIFASLITVMLLTSFASSLTVTAPELDRDSNSIQITLFSDVSETVTFSGLQPIEQEGKTIIFNQISPTDLTENVAKIVTLSYTIHPDFEFLLGNTYSTQLTVTGSESAAVTQTLEFEEGDYCDLGEQGNWVRIRSVSDERIDNKNAWEWKPLDNIEITVEIQNDRDDDISGVIEYGLYDTSENEFVFEDDLDFDVDEDEREEFTIDFKIDPSDLNSGTGSRDYIFYVKVYDDDDGRESTQCKQFSRNVEITQNKDEVVLDVNEVIITPSELMCGSQVTVTAELFNIGSRDQDDVTFRVYNRELGVDVLREMGDIDLGESKKAVIVFDLPEFATEKIHYLELSILDEDGDIYEITDSNNKDSEARYSFALNLTSGSCVLTPKASIFPSLESGGKAGSEMVVKAIITNNGKDATFVITAEDYEDWATLKSFDSSTFLLGEGDSKEVLITLIPKSDAVGDQTFNLILKIDNAQSESISQPVLVTVEKAGFSLPNFTIGGSWYIWVIGLINLILVIVIVIVAVRVVRGK